ncbi:2-hydroxyacid dehydrogenase [Cuneatibacter sp. NSJ-177]|uniref:2-hydroxyacid dehydrogenase n=1 Tax=Cuneatibacter sp. NSJ-177 TaxID=2931401 RepID=UPI001FD40088|nr:2-hydroxyacid dehydrogenase [Cuneatibacter sp. NSJ-177]MCJ7834116.1 2-hydroxyacid dehydrogenase [Cuneatibacter sp. NSJ-177]
MEKTKILMTRSLLPVDQIYIKDGLKELVGNSFELVVPPTYDEAGLLTVIEEADVLLGPFVTRSLLERGKNLRLIQVPWTGMDTFDFAAMEDSNVPVCNSHSNAAVVAELCVTLLADLLKKASYHDRKMRNGNWNRDKKPLDLSSRMISKQTVCILGYGNIGRRTGKLLSAFGAKILAVTEHTKTYSEGEVSYSSKNMMEAVSKATVVINALPLTDFTKGMIDENFLAQMRPDSYLINISRASVVDEDSVYEALVNGRLAGFASDVWWNAPKRGESQSWPSTHNKFEELDQVVLSPHRAGYVEGALPHLDDVIINLAHFIKGEPLMNRVFVEKMF